MEHFGYLFAAYSIIFVAIFLYVLFIWQRQSRLEAELRAMEARLRALDAPRPEQPAAEPPQPPPVS
jgi:CcmD family protein